MVPSLSEYDRLGLMERRVRYLVGARLRDRERMIAAMKTQDALRKEHSASEEWSSVSVVRKWRDSR